LPLVFRPPIHSKIDDADALLHARLVAFDGIVSVRVQQNLQDQLLACHHDAVGRARHAALGIDLQCGRGLHMLVDEMIEHEAPDGAGVAGNLSFRHIKRIAKAGLIGIC
jgi:hypothetical protein